MSVPYKKDESMTSYLSRCADAYARHLGVKHDLVIISIDHARTKREGTRTASVKTNIEDNMELNTILEASKQYGYNTTRMPTVH